MSAPVPILEQIALTVVDRLETVTIANGYQQDIAEVQRPTRLGGYRARDLLAVVAQRSPEQDEENSTEGNPRGIAWDQPFEIALYRFPSDKDTIAIDTLINIFASDCTMALTGGAGSDWQQFGGLAMNAWMGESLYFGDTDGAFSGIVLVFHILYRISEIDPYIVA